MNAKGISIAFVCLATLLVTEADGKTGLKGTFTWNKRSCKWREGFVGTSLNRLLSINCKKKGNLPSITCTYRGNPHPCRWYNQNHQANFYACLARVLSGDQVNLCNPGIVNCNTNCEDVTFEKVSANSYYQDSEGSVDDYYIDNY
ncbi:uncharacterized protein LOC127831823 [Dreissena polymorpha]|uniref:Secreted protein n=1 Tax=Dreissena polymorpha TaxID=45954 RepID=A0A9D4GVC5_DREPO|nr:uncharacterized protein LOC127831823 [Dreissena polymorpha]KAH3822225.1 hypothetical protein DPMN_123999 [Dreissena polymorpha]